MPDTDAERDAARTRAYFDALVRMGTSERLAAELTVAYVLSRFGRDRDREAWEPEIPD